MDDAFDLSLAESAYLALLDAQHRPSVVATDLVRALKIKTKNSGNQSHEIEIAQADAWLAICALSKSLDSDYETAPDVWSRAISRTEEWRKSFGLNLLSAGSYSFKLCRLPLAPQSPSLGDTVLAAAHVKHMGHVPGRWAIGVAGGNVN